VIVLCTPAGIIESPFLIGARAMHYDLQADRLHRAGRDLEALALQHRAQVLRMAWGPASEGRVVMPMEAKTDPVKTALLALLDSPEFRRMMEETCRKVCREEMARRKGGA